MPKLRTNIDTMHYFWVGVLVGAVAAIMFYLILAFNGLLPIPPEKEIGPSLKIQRFIQSPYCEPSTPGYVQNDPGI